MSEKTLLEIPIKKATEMAERKLRILIYGEAGVGKTTLLSTLPRPCLVIDFEAGADLRLRGEDEIYIAEVNSGDDLRKLLSQLPKLKKNFQSIAFDGFSVFVDRLLKEIIEKRKKAGKLKGDSPGFYEWGQLSAQARGIILSLFKTDAHVIFTALSKTKIDRDTGEVLGIYPDMPRSIRRTLRAMVDLEGYLYDEGGEKKIVFQSKKGIAEVKDRSGRLSKEPANLGLIIKKIFAGK
jgi:phage nucleotide-binding protein